MVGRDRTPGTATAGIRLSAGSVSMREPLHRSQIRCSLCEPRRGCVMRIVHESFRLMKVRRQHVEGTQRRQHAHIMGPVVSANVDGEPLMDQHGDGLECDAGDTSRRIGKLAREPAWQNPDRVGSEIDGVGNGRVVGDATIDEHTSVDGDRREDSRNRRRRTHRVDGVAVRQQNLFAATPAHRQPREAESGSLRDFDTASFV